MTVYTDSLSNLKNYRTDFFRIAVSTFLSYSLQVKTDAWFDVVAPSKLLNDKFEQGELSWEEFERNYIQEMASPAAQSKIDWIRHYSKNHDVVLLCFEQENEPCCHRHILKKLIEKDDL
ncbi:MAG: DUF488 domain-containing protein [Thermoproteota archaeon]|nr:DUF488 domain-containing protein [Thermoproteota archaeon]